MKTIKYIISIFFFLGGIGMVGSNEIIPATILIILGIVLFPKINDSLKQKFITFNKRKIRYTIYISLFILSGVFMNKENFEVIVEERKRDTFQHEETETEKINRIMGNDDFWNMYSSDLKKRIYQFIIDKNCKGLQNEFKIADSNSKNNLKRTGKNNSYLMRFIDKKMQEIDCYD